MAEKGEWEKVDGLHRELLLAMEAIWSSEPHYLTKAGNTEQVERALQLLHSAVSLCSERKDQIASLINAFTKSIDAPAKP
jgi:hypothetical protein